jgi:hypothetical protein
LVLNNNLNKKPAYYIIKIHIINNKKTYKPMDFEISELDIQKLINLSISTPETTSTDHEAV